MSPMISIPACFAISTDQCGAGCVSGAPGVRINAEKFAQEMVRRSAVMKPACAALATLSALSSPATTSAPPAFSAWQLASPEPPSPNTATVLPAKEVTGIKVYLVIPETAQQLSGISRFSDVQLHIVVRA